ncbi:unnamed protein product [Heligmosomoides polygyrus]|uniref:Reverse transcriptase domain-containing protein n=1 Tax=Heligmosomoides polygyrus TaxID=6339 RepID=A0A183G9F2_HELPZ|nr:unnamed protein product [Heligmosomoides polygyrus]
MELPHPAIPSVGSVGSPVHKISVEETEAVLKKMKPGSKGEESTGVLAQQYDDSDLEEEGQSCCCSNYGPIRLLSHSMKIFDRVHDRQIREIVKLSDNQCGFVAGCGTIGAIHAARLLVEKHREKQKPVHIAFLDFEKAFDRVPRLATTQHT